MCTVLSRKFCVYRLIHVFVIQILEIKLFSSTDFKGTLLQKTVMNPAPTRKKLLIQSRFTKKNLFYVNELQI